MLHMSGWHGKKWLQHVTCTNHTGGGHSHRLYSHNYDHSRSMVNGQKGAVNGQSLLRNTVNGGSLCRTDGRIRTNSNSKSNSLQLFT